VFLEKKRIQFQSRPTASEIAYLPCFESYVISRINIKYYKINYSTFPTVEELNLSKEKLSN